MPEVILVDNQDNPIGTMEKMEAHRKGLLHRAFSVFLFHPDGRMLLQQRAMEKYHSPGLWTNACCSHPLPGESLEDAAQRRLVEEIDLSCPLRYHSHLLYLTELEGGMVEHEYDHVFIGITERPPKPNPAEVMATEYLSPAAIHASMNENPDLYTVWFRLLFERVADAMRDVA